MQIAWGVFDSASWQESECDSCKPTLCFLQTYSVLLGESSVAINNSASLYRQSAAFLIHSIQQQFIASIIALSTLDRHPHLTHFLFLLFPYLICLFPMFSLLS